MATINGWQRCRHGYVNAWDITATEPDDNVIPIPQCPICSPTVLEPPHVIPSEWQLQQLIAEEEQRAAAPSSIDTPDNRTRQT